MSVHPESGINSGIGPDLLLYAVFGRIRTLLGNGPRVVYNKKYKKYYEKNYRPKSILIFRIYQRLLDRLLFADLPFFLLIFFLGHIIIYYGCLMILKLKGFFKIVKLRHKTVFNIILIT